MADHRALHRVLRKFARTMAGSYDITDALYELSDNAVEVFGATAAGVALCDGDVLRFVTATSEAAVEAERAQERLQAGPCYTSLEECRAVPVDDVREHHDQWPDYCPVVEQVGFLSVLGLPLVLDDRRIGSLDVYHTERRDWSEESISAGEVLGDIAAAYVLNASELAQSQRTAEQLQTALDSRVIIEQAKGRLGGELGIDPDEAYDLIRRFARSNHATVKATCEDVLLRGAAAVTR